MNSFLDNFEAGHIDKETYGRILRMCKMNKAGREPELLHIWSIDGRKAYMLNPDNDYLWDRIGYVLSTYRGKLEAS